MYRPILRWKRGEQRVLRELRKSQRAAAVWPVLVSQAPYEPPEQGGIDGVFEQRLTQEAKRIVECWDGLPCSFDIGDIADDAICTNGLHPVEFFFNRLSELGTNSAVRPVVSPSFDDLTRVAAAKVCATHSCPPTFRLTPNDLTTNDLSSWISDLCNEVPVKIGDCDVVVDLGHVDNEGRGHLTASGALSTLPYPNEWRDVFFVAGSTPPSVSPFPHGTHRLPRLEWLIFRNMRSSFPRLKFGDYGTIHPVAPSVDPRMMRPSASVKYTAGDEWVLLRGAGARDASAGAYSQFNAHAKTLVNAPCFRGEAFSYGDAEIARISQPKQSPGNLESWVTIALSHHIAEVVDQLSNLP